MSQPAAGADKLNVALLASALAPQLSPQSLLRQNEPLAKRTTLRVGGPADLYVEPATEPDLAAVLRFCAERQLPWFVLGRGSNLLVKDAGFRGVVVCLAQPFFSRIEVMGSPKAETELKEELPAPSGLGRNPKVQLCCGAGAKLKAVANEARRHALTGLEFLEGIPGSVGGALRMNAGAMGAATFEVVDSVRLMDVNGQVRECQPAQLAVAYRSCSTLKDHIALSALLSGCSGVSAMIEQRMHEFSQKRWKSQPAAPSAGCMFKNPAAIPAGKLIEELGLKGTRVGGAMVSHEHGNFLVNDAGATARDFLELIAVIRQKARAERGIELETEVQIIGE